MQELGFYNNETVLLPKIISMIINLPYFVFQFSVNKEISLNRPEQRITWGYIFPLSISFCT